MEISELKHVGPRGQGYFCIVKQYVDERTGLKYALKELKKEHYPKEEYRYRLTREIKLLNDLQDHENIIELINHGNDKDSEKLWYLMPYAEQNLYDYIKKKNTTLTKEERYSLVDQIIQAIKFAHSKGILHRDISPSNILVFEVGGKMIIKVSDFGLGKHTESLSYYTKSSASGYGQILYVSPEQRNKLKDATEKSDVYSIGKVIYFIFTGKDPDNLKPFELSSLVSKATDENPEDRFKNILELEEHFYALRKLKLEEKIPIEHISLKDVVTSKENIGIIELHELFVKGNYVDHVYYDFIEPVNTHLLTKDNLKKYYQAVGSGIEEFVKTYTDRLEECNKTVRWPFSSTSIFGEVLKKIIVTVNNDNVRLLCFKQLWYLAYEADQWSVQRDMKEVFNDKYISPTIELQLSEHIIKQETKIDVKTFANLSIPKVVKIGIIKSNEMAIKRQEEREKERIEKYGETEW
ncbi:MAG: serine/threonine-protein kinase [Cyclobacteriaceae bacterium]|jgi:serine/threonine protein kinase